MTLKSRLSRTALPVLIIAAGILILAVLLMNRPRPVKEDVQSRGVLVSTETVKAEDRIVSVRGTATVRAEREISVIPQVSGVVVKTSKEFATGGFFQKGETLFRINETDYRLALDRARAAEAQARVELATIKSKGRIARREWEQMKDKITADEPSPLVLYKPQTKSAKAALLSATASVKLAALNLRRTRVDAPFDCRVRSESVDTGQYVRAGTQVAVLAATDMAEIVVPLHLDELQWIALPEQGMRSESSSATVYMGHGGKRHGWPGRVARSHGEVDTKSRMVRIVVNVSDPYGLRETDGTRPPLLEGSFVDVVIKGKTLKDVITIKRKALRDDSTVWTVSDEGLLQIRKVEVLRIENDDVFISSGLRDGDTIVVSGISGAANGMKLRSMRDDSQ
jgi:RND family efflux transporter MFP subunit